MAGHAAQGAAVAAAQVDDQSAGHDEAQPDVQDAGGAAGRFDRLHKLESHAGQEHTQDVQGRVRDDVQVDEQGLLPGTAHGVLRGREQ